MKLKKKIYLGALALAAMATLASYAVIKGGDRKEKMEDPYNITLKKSDENVIVNIISTTSTLSGKKEKRFQYSDEKKSNFISGIPIVLDEDKEATIKVLNNSGVITNVHWHGLSIPNSQDGPDITLDEKGENTYKFTPKEAGTFWVHSHYRPVENQIEKGMYAPVIIRSEADKKYNLDEILMLADSQESEKHDSNMARMDMMDKKTDESTSIIDTINGKKIAPKLELEGGEIGKLRFINASANNFKTVKFPFKVRAIAKDGYNLAKGYETESITIAPGQRLDVEVILTGEKDRDYTIQDGNAKLKLIYKGNDRKRGISPFIPVKSNKLVKDVNGKAPDITMRLTEDMEMDASGMKMREMINGKVFPNTETFNVKVGQVYIVRFDNADTMAGMTHPMHVHGAHFQVISKNGKSTNDPTWYDTYPMAQHVQTDIAIKFDEPGVWMVHCHILKHEDNGMMASFTAK